MTFVGSDYVGKSQTQINEEFILACTAGDLPRVQFLLTSPHLAAIGTPHAQVEYFAGQAFCKACAQGHLAVVQYLVNQIQSGEVNIDAPSFESMLYRGLWTACLTGRLTVVEFLVLSPILGKHIDFHQDNEDILIKTCAAGHLNIVEFLTSSRLSQAGLMPADIHIRDNAPLITAACNKHFELFCFLLKLPDSNPWVEAYETPLALMEVVLPWACESGCLDIVRYILSSADIEALCGQSVDVNMQQGLALLCACSAGQLEVVKYLVESAKSDILINGSHAFLQSCQRKNYEVVKYLVFDADIPLGDSILQTPAYKSDPMVQEMFKTRELKKQLVEKLPMHVNVAKRGKL